MENKTPKKQSKNETVYKCDSKHCTKNGYHSKDDMKTITLKLIIGKDCPLDFEDSQTITTSELREKLNKSEVIPEKTPVIDSNIPSSDVVGEAAKMKTKTIVPPAFRTAMQPPPGMKLT